MLRMAELETLKVTPEWVEVEIVSEPYVLMTFRGYEPVVEVKVGGESKRLFIGPKSLGQAIDPAVKKQGGRFTGLRFRAKKESADRMAPYVVELIP